MLLGGRMLDFHGLVASWRVARYPMLVRPREVNSRGAGG